MSDFRAGDFKESLKLKASELLTARNYRTLKEAASELSSSGCMVSNLRNGRACCCSTTKLIHILHQLGYNVEIKFTRIEK